MNKEQLKKELQNIGNFTDEQVDKLESFMHATLEANKSFNLTAIKDEEKFRELMILDSAYPLKYYNFNGKKVIDIGTGAGYPGMVLATLSSGEFTLLDSTKKKVDYYSNFSAKNQYFNVNSICDRAEIYAKTHREEFDFAIARAVASLSVLVEIIVPLLKVGGLFLALKGPLANSEISNAKNALKNLDCSVEIVYEYSLPESSEKRSIVVIRKNKISKLKYPRNYSDIIK